MNKVDAFFIMASGILVWLFAIYLVPFKIMMFVNAGISTWAVGTFIGNLPRKLAKETDRDQLDEMYEICKQQLTLLEEMVVELRSRGYLISAAQAKIDELMFEYCPEEMTPEQIANYEAHQKVVKLGGEDEIEWRRGH